MSDLYRAVDAELQAFQPEQAPSFSVLLDRRRTGARRRTALVAGSGVAAVLLVVPLAWWAASGGDQLVQEAGPAAGEREVAFSARRVVEAAPQGAATGSLATPAVDGAAPFPGGYACGTPAAAAPAPGDAGLVVCTGDGVGEREILRLGPASLTADAVSGAAAEPSGTGVGWDVRVELTPDGSRAFAELTGEAACAELGSAGRKVALVVDGVVLGVPSVTDSVVCDEGIAAGSVLLTLPGAAEAQAQDLARRLTPAAAERS